MMRCIQVKRNKCEVYRSTVRIGRKSSKYLRPPEFVQTSLSGKVSTLDARNKTFRPENLICKFVSAAPVVTGRRFPRKVRRENYGNFRGTPNALRAPLVVYCIVFGVQTRSENGFNSKTNNRPPTILYYYYYSPPPPQRNVVRRGFLFARIVRGKKTCCTLPVSRTRRPRDKFIFVSLCVCVCYRCRINNASS